MTDGGNDNLRRKAESLPEALKAPVSRWLDRLDDANYRLPAELSGNEFVLSTLVSLIACSEFAAAHLLRDWHWFCGALQDGKVERATQSTETDVVDDLAIPVALRRRRNRGLVRILWRNTLVDDVWETLGELSALADELIVEAFVRSEEFLAPRFGYPKDKDGGRIPMVVLAMGKLGGLELNFSSDVDLIFLYAGNGETDGNMTLSAHEYFIRLSQQIVRLLDDVTEEGFVYRVDTRLRPFGNSGPPVTSFSALENYLLRHGREWERYAYVKARVVGSVSEGRAAAELHSGIIEPFVYRQYLDYGVFESLREMKKLIESEVRKRELAGNIKLGPGGIREIEFIVQSLQLVRGGADRALRCRDLRGALQGLGHDRALGHGVQQSLAEAYVFLRRFENALQAIRDQQTHDVPSDPVDQARLALALSYDDWQSLATDLQRHRDEVSSGFDQVAFRGNDEEPADDFAAQFASYWRSSTTVGQWEAWLAQEGFRDAARLAVSVSAFVGSTALRQVDVTGQRRLERFIRIFLGVLRSRSGRGFVVERVLAVISQVSRRSAYVALLNENPLVLERLIDLCEQSDYLAGEIEKYPALLDELLDPRLFTEQISAAGLEADLDDTLRQLNDRDSEGTIESLARFQRTSMFRIAVADVSGTLPIMKVSDCLTVLAELVLRAALSVAWRDLVEKHGEPYCDINGRRRKAGFGVVAYGKLGGMELSYGSDLDLVFLHDSVGAKQETDGQRPIDNRVFFGRLVRRLVHFLTTQTSSGALYEVDTRLRPSGRDGLLVVSVSGFERYQEDNAWTWEHQALLRSRAVAGSSSIARAFDCIRSATLQDRVCREKLLEDVLSMRSKMRENLDSSSTGRFDLKQGEGGIGDIEFLVQYLVLKNADHEPALVYYSDNIRQLGALEATALLPADDVIKLQDIYRRFRLRSHRLALDGEVAEVDSSEFEWERAFVRDIWKQEMR